MSASIHVVGLRDLDGQFAKMAAIKKMCEDSGVSYPKEVVEYFAPGGKKDEWKVKESIEYLKSEMEDIPLGSEYGNSHPCCKKLKDMEMCDGFVLDVSKLPPEVKRIKFYVSY